MYCGKDFCSECLLLQGPLEVIACCNCYENSLKRLTSSIKRRYLYVFLGIAGFVFDLVFLVFNFSRFDLTILLTLAAFSFLACVLINLIRIRQAKLALQKKPYSTHREEEEGEDESSTL